MKLISAITLLLFTIPLFGQSSVAISTEKVKIDGKVYYLHNRVKSIGDKVEQLRKMLPGARIEAAHGQMPEHELEKVMEEGLLLDFCPDVVEAAIEALEQVL